jgi:hypothetical protein
MVAPATLAYAGTGLSRYAVAERREGGPVPALFLFDRRLHWCFPSIAFMRHVVAMLLLSVPIPASSGIQLVLHYEALQRILAAQLFTQDGRNYVKGSKDARCNYAYLENPVIGAEKGRLSVKARFSGRAALDLLGRCIGLGDSFDVTILATPYYRARWDLHSRRADVFESKPRARFLLSAARGDAQTARSTTRTVVSTGVGSF